MVIYEVNLTINNEIFDEYYHWLVEHIKVMLTYSGFQQAEIARENLFNSNLVDKKKITVRYSIETEQDLDNYFKKYASKMQAESTEKFGNQFSVFRRIFKDPCILNLNTEIHHNETLGIPIPQN